MERQNLGALPVAPCDANPCGIVWIHRKTQVGSHQALLTEIGVLEVLEGYVAAGHDPHADTVRLGHRQRLDLAAMDANSGVDGSADRNLDRLPVAGGREQ